MTQGEASVAARLEAVVSCYSYNTEDGPTYGGLRTVNVERAGQITGPDLWAVRWMGRCVGRDGLIDFEPIPSSRSKEWLARYRFDDVGMALLAGHALAVRLREWVPNGPTPMPEQVEF